MPELRWPLCRQTVTLYHADPAARTVTRTVVRGVFLDRRRRAAPDADGLRGATAFLLILPQRAAPAGGYALAPQDRVLEGEGPEIGYDAWPDFVPAAVPGLCVVQYVDPKTAGGAPTHVEAGGYWTTAGSGAHTLTG